jgi:hypothetical protein
LRSATTPMSGTIIEPPAGVTAHVTPVGAGEERGAARAFG